MTKLNDRQGKNAEVNLGDEEYLTLLGKALSSPLRIDMLKLLEKRSMNVVEMSRALDTPVSTVALSVQVLEDAGMVTTELQPGKRGSMKLCSNKMDRIVINVNTGSREQENKLTLIMPIGGYSAVTDVVSTCGMATSKSNVGEVDDPECFYMPERFNAQLIWFRHGMLEYRFSHTQMRAVDIDWLELSFEACSEAPLYRDPWKSDISLIINNIRVGIWTCPCDCGGRKGKLTPNWWPELSTQYGFLKTWRVSHEGTFLDGAQISDVTIDNLGIGSNSFIDVKIGVENDAKYAGGLNLFGEEFGDFPQPIIMSLGYHMKTLTQP